MIKNFKDIRVNAGTYGTEIAFEVYDENHSDEDLSQYTVKAKFYNPTDLKTEEFGGVCTVEGSGNIAIYTFAKNDLANTGIYLIRLEMKKESYRNIVKIDYNLIVE
jgi:hypothetical protein